MAERNESHNRSNFASKIKSWLSTKLFMDSIYTENTTHGTATDDIQLHHKLQNKHRHPSSCCWRTAPSPAFPPFVPDPAQLHLSPAPKSCPPEHFALPGVKIQTTHRHRSSCHSHVSPLPGDYPLYYNSFSHSHDASGRSLRLHGVFLPAQIPTSAHPSLPRKLTATRGWN